MGLLEVGNEPTVWVEVPGYPGFDIYVKYLTPQTLKRLGEKATKKQRGFTLPEVILIVSVLAIISGMAFPDIALFFQRQQVEQEKLMGLRN